MELLQLLHPLSVVGKDLLFSAGSLNNQHYLINLLSLLSELNLNQVLQCLTLLLSVNSRVLQLPYSEVLPPLDLLSLVALKPNNKVHSLEDQAVAFH